MDRYFTKTFSRFLTAFLLILAVAFGVMIYVGRQLDEKPNPVDSVAQPQ